MKKLFVRLSVLSVLVACAPAAAELPPYFLRDLGTMGYRSAVPEAMNSAGHLVGRVYLDDLSRRAFYWDGGVHDLGPGVALGVDDANRAVGTTSPLEGAPGPYMEAWIWDGIRQGIGSGQATGVNNQGQIVGQREPSYHAFIRNADGTETEIATFGGNTSYAYDVNDMGQVVGQADLFGFPVRFRAFLWYGGVLQNLGTLGGNSRAWAINDRSIIVGTAYAADPITEVQVAHAVYWDGGLSIHDLGVGHLLGINNGGLMVGQADERFPVLWKDGEKVILPLPLYRNAAAVDINENGHIVGWFTDSEGRTHAAIWEPVPEPGTLSTLLLGLTTGSLMAIRRVRAART